MLIEFFIFVFKFLILLVGVVLLAFLVQGINYIYDKVSKLSLLKKQREKWKKYKV